ncbi:uncharacterized protein LOC130629723 isoform X2 [Hydractinia symbiolongicarpus]|uniref:uncharacterized protein LOC130629723 isoform X2 n=1 Tax=Hydractinia symbiolongicarpus TaxID=13093 RepID=UPI002550E6F3|nr:uncharacterized protein LOC130629723 isoform X2 [Hydractinia symbiolongicarpus]
MPAGDMDSEYSVGINNRFIGIDSDMTDDPLELIRSAQEKPKKVKEVKPKVKKDAKPTKGTKDKPSKIDAPPTESSETRRSETSDRPRGRGRGRGRGGDRGRGRGRGGGFGSVNSPQDENTGGFGDSNPSTGGGPRGPRGACHRCGEEGHFVRNCPQAASPGGPPASDGFGAPSNTGFGFGAPSGFGSSNDNEDERRGGRGGFRGGRGGRGGRGRGGRGGREFDRRSGSDKSSVKAFDKRDGSGQYNWGTAQDELAASEEQQSGFGTPKEAEDVPAENTEETTETGNVSGNEENKENVEAPQISFDEYKQQLEQSRSKPQYNIRKANEGEKIKGLKQLKKPTEEENEADGSLFFPKRYIEEKLKTSGRVKEHLNLEFQYTSGDNRHMDTDKGRRGGRGRGRGGRSGRRDESMGFGGGKKIQLENNEEFPSL